MMNWYDIPGNATVPAGPRGNDTDAMNGNAVMYDAVAGKIFTSGGALNYGGGVRRLCSDSKCAALILGPAAQHPLTLTRSHRAERGVVSIWRPLGFKTLALASRMAYRAKTTVRDNSTYSLQRQCYHAALAT